MKEKMSEKKQITIGVISAALMWVAGVVFSGSILLVEDNRFMNRIDFLSLAFPALLIIYGVLIALYSKRKGMSKLFASAEIAIVLPMVSALMVTVCFNICDAVWRQSEFIAHVFEYIGIVFQVPATVVISTMYGFIEALSPLSDSDFVPGIIFALLMAAAGLLPLAVYKMTKSEK